MDFKNNSYKLETIRRMKMKMKPMHVWVKSIIDTTPGLSQKGLAEAMDLNPAAVNRMIHGARKIKVDELPIIEAYLGQPYNAQSTGGTYIPPTEIYGSGQPARQMSAQLSTVNNSGPVPVFGRQDETIEMRINLEDDEPIDWVVRHPSQNGLANAFAVYVFSSDMKPRYFPGELVYLHPVRPPEVGRDCLIKTVDGQILLRRYIDREGQNFHMRQFNPPQDDIIKKKDILKIYNVIGRG